MSICEVTQSNIESRAGRVLNFILILDFVEWYNGYFITQSDVEYTAGRVLNSSIIEHSIHSEEH